VSAGWKRRLLYAGLYLSEGAPIGFLWWFLQAQLRIAGVPIGRVTALTASLALPWALKFLWAPVLDLCRGPRWGYRSWMLLAQALMGLALLPLAWLDLAADYGLVYALCLAHAFFAATQDVAIDALAIATTPPGERGSVNGWMQVGMYLGRSIFGGLALVVAVEFGTAAVVLALCASIWGIGLLAATSRLLVSPPRDASGHGALARLKRAVWRPDVFYGILFALVGGVAFEALGGIASAYLVDRGYDRAGIGTFLGVATVACVVAGSLLGGRLTDGLGALRATAWALVGVAATVAATPLAPDGAALFLLLGAFYFGIGVFTASSYALFMDLTEVGLAATQFTVFMAATNLCESWSVFAAGRLAGPFGYRTAFLVVAAVSLLGLPLLRRIRGAHARMGAV